jgi:hypothetical protein
MLDVYFSDLSLLSGVENATSEKIGGMVHREMHLRNIKSREVGLRDRALSALGTTMVSLGRRLQERSVLVLTQSPGANQSDC